MLKLLVIADDFTGALDTGVQFSNQGAKTLVITEKDVVYETLATDVEVLVLNTESRHLSFAQTYDITQKIITQAQQANVPHIYQKVDSALRGNISAELQAINDVTYQKIIPVIPAYPKMNRVVIDGNLYIGDDLVSDSVFAKDPYNPVTESNIIKRLKEEANIEATLIQHGVLPPTAQGVCVFDTQTDDELEQYASVLDKGGHLKISVGCAGFATVLARLLFPHQHSISYRLEQPIVVICGSVNPITKAQIDYLSAADFPRISLTTKQLLDWQHWESDRGRTEIVRYLNLINTHTLIAFETHSERTTNDIIALSKEATNDATDYHSRIGESLGKLTRAFWQAGCQGTFFFIGGDTLFQSMKILGVESIEPVAEITSGVVLSKIEWNGRAIQVITKSGGFGTKSLLTDINKLAENKEEKIK